MTAETAVVFAIGAVIGWWICGSVTKRLRARRRLTGGIVRGKRPIVAWAARLPVQNIPADRIVDAEGWDLPGVALHLFAGEHDTTPVWGGYSNSHGRWPWPPDAGQWLWLEAPGCRLGIYGEPG